MNELSMTTINDQNPISTVESEIKQQLNQNNEEKIHNNNLKSTTWTERLKSYFITNNGRIMLSNFCFTLICVILQHVMGTCDHFVSDGAAVIKWHVFTPPC